VLQQPPDGDKGQVGSRDNQAQHEHRH
jgi:hypothetical protein